MSGKYSRQVVGKSVLQADTEFIQLHRYNTDERTGEEAFQDIERRGLNGRSAVLVFDGRVKHGDRHACNKERPAEQREQLDCRLHPIEIEDIRAHISHHGEEVRYRAVNGFIEPFQHRVPYYIGDLFSEKIEHAADGVSDPRKNIS